MPATGIKPINSINSALFDQKMPATGIKPINSINSALFDQKNPATGIKTINSINSVNRFFGIENRLLDLVDAFNANGAHTKAASSPFFVLWKHVFGPQ